MIQSLRSNIFSNCKNEAKEIFSIQSAESVVKYDKLKKKAPQSTQGGMDCSSNLKIT